MNSTSRLEARALIESTGNYADNEIDDVMDVYDAVAEHIGFEDTRHDKRYVVKFYHVFFFTPEEYIHTDEFIYLFEDFCMLNAEWVADCVEERDDTLKVGDVLSNIYVGNYQPFAVDIQKITQENAAQVAMDVYDENPYNGAKYVNTHIATVVALNDLEDSYMDDWLTYLEENDAPADIVKATREAYEDYKRRQNNNDNNNDNAHKKGE